jgi:hypothetical protein
MTKNSGVVASSSLIVNPNTKGISISAIVETNINIEINSTLLLYGKISLT